MIPKKVRNRLNTLYGHFIIIILFGSIILIIIVLFHVFQAPMDGLAYPILFVDEGKFIPTTFDQPTPHLPISLLPEKCCEDSVAVRRRFASCQAKSCKTSFPPRFFFQKSKPSNCFFSHLLAGKCSSCRKCYFKQVLEIGSLKLPSQPLGPFYFGWCPHKTHVSHCNCYLWWPIPWTKKIDKVALS